MQQWTMVVVNLGEGGDVRVWASEIDGVCRAVGVEDTIFDGMEITATRTAETLAEQVARLCRHWLQTRR